MSKKFLVTFMILAILSFIALATLPSDPFTEATNLFQGPGKYGGTLYLVLGSEPQSWNYYGTLSAAAYTVDGQLFSPLVQANPITNEVEPALASSWDISSGGTEVVFHLRHVLWSDGVPFTADDVLFTFNDVVMNKHALGNEWDRFTVDGTPIKWVKINDYTVAALLPKPYGAFFTVLEPAFILPKHILANYLPQYNPKVTDPSYYNQAWTVNTPPDQIVGTGPYVLYKYVPGQEVILKKNPNFWEVDPYGNQLPYFNELDFLIVKDPQTQLAMFQSGQISWLGISASQFPYLKQKQVSGAPFSVYNTLSSGQATPHPFITFNFDDKNPNLKALFNNLQFREAMEYALDRNQIINEVYNGLASFTGDIPAVLPGNVFYDPEASSLARNFNLEAANGILDSLGLKRGPNGIRQFPDGQPVEFNLLTWNNSPTMSGIAVIYQKDLAKIGIKLNLQILDISVTYQLAMAGNFDAALLSWGDQPDPALRTPIWSPGYPLYINHLSTMNSKTQQPLFDNMTWWEKIVYNDFAQGQAQMTLAERVKYYDQWEEIYATEIPYIFVAVPNTLIAVQNNIGNFFIAQNGQLAFTTYTTFLK